MHLNYITCVKVAFDQAPCTLWAYDITAPRSLSRFGMETWSVCLFIGDRSKIRESQFEWHARLESTCRAANQKNVGVRARVGGQHAGILLVFKTCACHQVSGFVSIFVICLSKCPARTSPTYRTISRDTRITQIPRSLKWPTTKSICIAKRKSGITDPGWDLCFI